MAKQKNNKTTQRLDKCVAHLTGLSRQMATSLIKDGCVSVDDEVIYEAARKISLESKILIRDLNDEDDLFLEQDAVSAKDAFKKRVFMLNKPNDFICADRDKNHRLVVSLFREELKNDKLHTVGRLDVDTTGVLIVTDDGDLNHEVTSPKKNISKLYYAKLDKALPESAVRKFASGIKHPEEKKPYQSAKLTIINNSEQINILSNTESDTEHCPLNQQFTACVQLSEGRYHEVKRLFEAVGCEVIELARLAIGKLTLKENFKVGEYVLLSKEECDLIFEEHDYSLEEMHHLIDIYEQNLYQAPLSYLPKAYREKALASYHEENIEEDDDIINDSQNEI